MSKKVAVKKIDEEKREIILEKKDKPLFIFFRNHWLILFITALILSLTIFILAVIYTVSSLVNSNSPTISKVPISASFGDELTAKINDSGPISEAYVNGLFNQDVSGYDYGIILINDTVRNDKEKYSIIFYSDGTAKKIYDNGKITRISSLDNGEYGISKNGDINVNARTLDITITKKEKFSYGTITYYSDGSAEILDGDGKVIMLIRDSNSLSKNSILNSIVAVYDEDNGTITKYTDGTTLVLKDNTYYITSGTDVSDTSKLFKEVGRDNLSDGRTIIYFSNGSAVIKDGKDSISVRKSNAINVINNKIFDIKDSNYVKVCDSKKLRDGRDIIFYTDGSAVIKDGNKYQYVSDSNNVIMDTNGNVVRVDGDVLNSSSVITNDGNKTINFGDVSLVELDDASIIIGKNNDLIFDSLGNFKGFNSDNDSDLIKFTVSNNNSSNVKYVVVFEESDRSELSVNYVQYKVRSSVSNLTGGKLANRYWSNDKLAGGLNMTGTNYVLLSGTLKEYEKIDVSLFLYVLDDGTVQNEIMDKYYYGTIKVYAWMNK
mgnify:FL=1